MMAFENVKMGPIEKAFVAWQEAEERATLAEMALANHAKFGGEREFYAFLQIGHTKPGSSGETHYDKPWKAVSDSLLRILKEDLDGNVRAAVKASRLEAESLRQEFLRLTMRQIAGDDAPTPRPEVSPADARG